MFYVGPTLALSSNVDKMNGMPIAHVDVNWLNVCPTL